MDLTKRKPRTSSSRAATSPIPIHDANAQGAGSDTGDNGDIIQALRRGSSERLNQTGQKVVQRNLIIQPTLTIRPGFPVRVIVNRDLVLEPYKGGRTHGKT